MRIALFHNAPSGGAKRAIYEWTRRLVEYHSIDVFTLRTADHDFCDVRPLVSDHEIFDFEPRQLFASPFGRLNQLQRLRDLAGLEIVERQMADKINSGKYDLLFTHTCQFTVIPTIIRLVQLPSIHYLHEPYGPAIFRQIPRPYERRSPWRERLDQIDPFISSYKNRLDELQRASIAHTGLVLSNSLFTQAKMSEEYDLNAPVCYYGVDYETFCPDPRIQKDFFVFSVGELSPRKGFDFLIESIRLIPLEERPKLKIACNSVQGDEKEYLEDLARRSQVELELLYHQDSHQLSAEYNRALLCVYSPVQEPFGLVPLESMACGTAVIGIKEGGVMESIVNDHTGLLVDRDPEQFAVAIQRLLLDRSLADQYGRNGREHVIANWTWDNSAMVLNKHLNRISQLELNNVIEGP